MITRKEGRAARAIGVLRASVIPRTGSRRRARSRCSWPPVAELLAQRGDLHVDGPVRHGVVLAVHARRTIWWRVKTQPGRPARKCRMPELGVTSGSRARRPTSTSCRPGWITRSWMRSTRLASLAARRRLARGAERRPRARDQHLRAEGLGDVVVGAQLQARHDVALLALGRQHDDRDVARGVGRASGGGRSPGRPGRAA